MIVTTDPVEISIHSKECLEANLFVDEPIYDGRYILMGHFKVHRMAYLQNIGWCIVHRWASWLPEQMWAAIYVREDMRRQGHGTALYEAIAKHYGPGILKHGRGTESGRHFFEKIDRGQGGR